MSITSEEELRGLREVGKIVAGALEAMAREVREGITTGELDAVGARYCAEHGARSAPQMVYKFPGVNCISANDEVVHGIPRERALRAGDLVKLDVTAEKNGFHGDAAVTVTVAPAREISLRLVQCAKQAFRAGLAAARPGAVIREIGAAIQDEVRRCGFFVIPELGGHGIGRTIHEPPSVPNYPAPSARQKISEGMVFTIEPIIAAGTGDVWLDQDGWTMRTKDGSLAAHYEHTVAIVDGKAELLTA
jgi:methionyl aminopeptidase